MNRREFLEKFVALSSASLILSGCVAKEQRVTYPESNNGNPKFKDIISDSNGGDQAVPVYGPPPVATEPNNNGFRPIIQQKR